MTIKTTGIKKTILSGILYFFAAAAFVSALPSNGGTDGSMRRFGIFIGSNNGGRDRIMLRYAVSDARTVSKVFAEMGGIAASDNTLLVEPTVRDINSRIDALREQVIRSKGSHKRTEIVFYYSGHSDEEGLLLNREHYSYRELRNRINNIPSDMRIVILDSCASGAFTQLKGGTKTQPFLVDSSLSAEGYAFLTSSSADEASQESDRIGSSYFTHSVVAGLRGAADSVGDGRVTLNELYRFAYTETLAQTETSLLGTQHPSYDIQVNGMGDLVLTDIKDTSASLVFEEKMTGRLSIRDSADHLIAEITKTVARPLELGLEPGRYRVTLQQGNTLSRAQCTLVEGRRTLVTGKDFSVISGTPARLRGEEENAREEKTPPKTTLYSFFFNSVPESFQFPLIGFVNIAWGIHTAPQIGFINWNTKDFSSLQLGFINTAGGDVNGAQIGFVNTAAGGTVTGGTKGMQFGFVNTTPGLHGTQIGFINTTTKESDGFQLGFVNVATQAFKGVQFGFVNYADSVENGVPIGIFSIVKQGGYYALEYSVSEYYPVTLGFKIGVEKFYTTIFAAYDPFGEYNDSYLLNHFAAGLGFGSIIPITGSFFFNPELNDLFSLQWGTRDDSSGLSSTSDFLSLVTSFGFKLGRHFSITAGPSVTWAQTFPGGRLKKPFFAIAEFPINEENSIVVGARAAVQVRF